MECRDCEALISRFIDDECDAGEKNLLKRHLAICDACMEFYEILKGNDEVVTAALHSEFFGETAVEKIMTRLREQSTAPAPGFSAKPRRSTLWERLPRPAWVVAASALFALVLLGYGHVRLRNEVRDVNAALAAVTQTARAAQARHTGLYADALLENRKLLDALSESMRALQLPRADASSTETRNPPPTATAEPGTTIFTERENDLNPVACMSVEVSAMADGNVVRWKTPDTLCVTGYTLHRAGGIVTTPEGNTASIALNPDPLIDSFYVDTDIYPNTEYTYTVEAATGAETGYLSEPVKVVSRNDTRIDFMGIAESPEGVETAIISVSKRLPTGWRSRIFNVKPGSAIGARAYEKDLKQHVDYSTRFTLTALEKAKIETKSLMTYVPRRDDETGELVRDASGKIVRDLRVEEYPVLNSRIVYTGPLGCKNQLWRGRSDTVAGK